jgi:hypothetical protein
MTAISDDEQVLERPIAGFSRVAEAIASMPTEDKERALAVAEESYCKTAVELGCAEPQARAWAPTVMADLRAGPEEKSPGWPDCMMPASIAPRG